MIRSFWQFFLAFWQFFPVALVLCACATDQDIVQVEKADYQLYNDAMDEMLADNYRDAALLFDEVERQHPYSSWGIKGQIMRAFCYYRINDYEEAIITLTRFIDLHPGNPDVAYAQYLKGLSYYEQVRDVSRDQNNSELALKAFRELENRFPESRYARDAQKKIALLTDHLAGKEIEVGRYYQKRDYHLAAVNRYRNVVDDYDTTVHTAEALHRLVESYLALGMILEARKAASVLGYNYPESDWYRDAYALLADNNFLDDHNNNQYRADRQFVPGEDAYGDSTGAMP